MKSYFRLGLMILVCAFATPLLRAQSTASSATPGTAATEQVTQDTQEAQAPAENPSRSRELPIIRSRKASLTPAA